MPTWNQSLSNCTGYDAILTNTRQLPEKTFPAVQDLKPAFFPASSPPSQQAHGSQDQGSLRSVFLVAWSCRHPDLWLRWDPGGRMLWNQPNSSEALHVSPPWVVPPPFSMAQGPSGSIFKKCWHEIWVFHAYAKHCADPLLRLGVASYLPWTYKSPSICFQ